jgi:hypothetical protein
MPWHVEKKKPPKPFKVVNNDTGEIVGSHKTRQAADAQVRSLYANTDEAEKPGDEKKAPPAAPPDMPGGKAPSFPPA